MTSFFPFFIVLLAAVIFSRIFTRMRIPWVVALIIGGIVIGPSGFGVFESDATIDFFATMGLVLLMFMAGLESHLASTKGIKGRLIISGIFIGLLPAVVGVAIALNFGYSLPTALLVGIMFMSSAIAILIPQLQSQKIIGSDLGKVLVGAAITVDGLSLILLSVFLQLIAATFSLWIIAIYAFLVALIVITIWFIPKIRWLTFSEEYTEEQDLFEKELRFIILILVGFVIFFELAGLHAIVAAFFAGLALSSFVKSHLIKAKLHAISYGFFVPVFFVVIGASTDISAFTNGFGAIFLALSIVVGLMASKMIGGWIAGRLSGFNNRESVFLGVSAMPQLSTTLAVAFLGFTTGLLDQDLLASIIALTIITATVAPIMVSLLAPKLTSQKVATEEVRKKK